MQGRNKGLFRPDAIYNYPVGQPGIRGARKQVF